MKIACVNVMVSGESLSEKAEKLARYGFDGIEIFFEENNELKKCVEEVKRLASRTGVVPCAFSMTGPADGWIMQANQNMSKSARLLLDKSIEAAGELGLPTIIVYEMVPQNSLPLFETRPDMPPDVRKRFIDMLGELTEQAESSGAFLVLEPLNRYESRYMNTLLHAASFAEAINSKRLAIMADLFHMAIEEASIPESIIQAGIWIKHVHLGDSNRLLPGCGHIDFVAAFAALKRIGYDGFLSLECGIEGKPETELPKCAEFLKKNVKLTDS